MTVNPAILKFLRNSLLVLVVLFALPESKVKAQSVNGTDISSINVDDLSDEQILNYMKQAKDRGVSDADLESLARQRGVSETQILKLRKRIQSLSGIPAPETPQIVASDASGNSLSVTNQDIFGLLTSDDAQELTHTQKKVFGFDLFKKSGLSFAPNLYLPTPKDYILGPGDELVVDLWGSTQQFFTFEVTREGTIRPQNIGPIYVNGLTVDQASKRIIARLTRVYSGLKGKNGQSPTIFHQISLGNIRTINVEIVGSVMQAGTYALPSLATVYTALHAAGGPTVNGSFRNVRLIRDNKLHSVLDIYDFLTEGVKSGDIGLRSGDVIMIPSYISQIALQGEVKRPGLYELKEGESLSKLLDFANGFSDRAFEKVVTVKRNGKSEREMVDVTYEGFDSFVPQNGDVIEVGEILDRFSNRVVINGAVFRTGEYELTDGLTLKTLILKAEGLRGDVYKTRVSIYRVKEDFSQEVIPIDLGAVMSGAAADVVLQSEDVVNITSIYDLGEESFVQITGEVVEGGAYPYFSKMTVPDLVVLAGGFKESASGAYIEVSRRNKNGNINSTAEIISMTIDKDLNLSGDIEAQFLEPFDQVYIRMSPGYSTQDQLTVEGEVLVPGTYTIGRKDERISDIISRAKGFTPYAYLEGAILIRRTEFALEESNAQINLDRLDELRWKILNGQSEVKNAQATGLLSRIEKLRAEVEKANSNDVLGSRFKRKLIKGFTEGDSLVNSFDLTSQEPVALRLAEIMNNPGGKYDMIVKPGDLISVPGKLETVRVAGEVTSPLNVLYEEGFNFRDYINKSGGFMSSAKKGRSYVQYPNGERHGVKRFLFFKKYPKIEPGSTIIVSRKPERKGVNLQAILASAGSLATLALVIDRLAN